jgi:hypothetical protein
MGDLTPDSALERKKDIGGLCPHGTMDVYAARLRPGMICGSQSLGSTPLLMTCFASS